MVRGAITEGHCALRLLAALLPITWAAALMRDGYHLDGVTTQTVNHAIRETSQGQAARAGTPCGAKSRIAGQQSQCTLKLGDQREAEGFIGLLGIEGSGFATAAGWRRIVT